MAQLLAGVPQDQLLLQSHSLEQTLRSLPVIQNAQKVGVYMNMDHSEVKTIGLIKALFDMGKKVYLPHCAPLTSSDFKRFDRQTSKLIFFQMPTAQSVLDLKPQGKYKLLEPTSGLDVMDETSGIDVILLPAVAYTKECFRLGHGAGFYDDYIKRHTSKFGMKPFLIGTGLKEQLVSEIPTEPHDEKLDLVVLADKVYSPHNP